MVYWIFILLAYIIVGVFTYDLIDDYKGSKWERVWLSAFWIMLIPLYIIHWLHKKL